MRVFLSSAKCSDCSSGARLFIPSLVAGLLLLATSVSVTADDPLPVVINEIMAANVSACLAPDYSGFPDWIELYNTGAESVDLSGLYLTDNLSDPTKWPIPPGTVIEPDGFLLVWADEKAQNLHASFKLSREGEAVGLFSPDGSLVDSLEFDAQLSDVSLGRWPDGSDNWLYFGQPSPNGSNTPFEGIATPTTAPQPHFSLPGGFYSGAQDIDLGATASGVVHLTLDGSLPSPTSPAFSESIHITSTTVIRARTFAPGYLPSATATFTYLIDEDPTLPVVSIATRPDHLWDYDMGIYVQGPGEPGCWVGTANYCQDWERPISFELYDADQSLEVAFDAGVKIFGFGSRINPQKSLAIYARDKYGSDSIDLRLFADKPGTEFRRILLRNSGQDWGLTMLRDGMMQSLVIGQMDVDYQAYRPALVFLNGQFWGIHNIREKADQHYALPNHGYAASEIDLLEATGWVIAGNGEHYADLINFVSTQDMTDPDSYAFVRTQMDVDEYINYQIAQIYYANVDWPQTNVKFWRPQTVDGRWRWILFDVEMGFGYHHGRVDYDSIERATWPHDYCDKDPCPPPPAYTVLLRRLLENPDFKAEFIQRFAAFLNTTLAPERVLDIIEQLSGGIAPEMPGHIERWAQPPSLASWQWHLDVTRDFARRRPDFVRQHIRDYFDVDMVSLTTDVAAPGGGKILINQAAMPVEATTGLYFQGVPMRITAVADYGYRFAGWQGLIAGQSAVATITPLDDGALTAFFEPAEPLTPSLVINEIHYNPASDQGDDDDYEFLELYNTGDATVDMSGFAFTDGVYFTFPHGASVAPDEYLVVAINAETYSGQGYQVFEWTDGKLSNGGEMVELRDATSNIIDQVDYDDDDPWPELPDGDGPSLMLEDPSFDNALPENWRPSLPVGGTPGRSNLEFLCYLPLVPMQASTMDRQRIVLLVREGLEAEAGR